MLQAEGDDLGHKRSGPRGESTTKVVLTSHTHSLFDIFLKNVAEQLRHYQGYLAGSSNTVQGFLSLPVQTRVLLLVLQFPPTIQKHTCHVHVADKLSIGISVCM
ncbi:hypothetical protein AMECASPLE_027920 [Ameca splendens]|uniref:Uncharacterized protein n=1 Tax=Ameca splendens TaxID=208324 RepID=A0ABV1ABM9_9TELE